MTLFSCCRMFERGQVYFLDPSRFRDSSGGPAGVLPPQRMVEVNAVLRLVVELG